MITGHKSHLESKTSNFEKSGPGPLFFGPGPLFGFFVVDPSEMLCRLRICKFRQNRTIHIGETSQNVIFS